MPEAPAAGLATEVGVGAGSGAGTGGPRVNGYRAAQ